MFSFSVNALVADAETGIIDAMRERSRLTRVSRNGTLVVPLLGDREMSHASYPAEWDDAQTDRSPLFRFRPNFTTGFVHEVCDFPEALADSPYKLVLEAAEVHSRGSYCQVVTGYTGEQLRPYRREGSHGRLGSEYVHPTASIFSAPAMGLLRLDANQARRQGNLTIHRAAVEVVNGLVTVIHERLLRLDDPSLAFSKLTSLSDELKNWEPALEAHYERWECEAGWCDGHYHLD